MLSFINQRNKEKLIKKENKCTNISLIIFWISELSYANQINVRSIFTNYNTNNIISRNNVKISGQRNMHANLIYEGVLIKSL
jgi:hypothetical protein